MATLNFNANTVEPAQGFDPIPAGKYVAAITASEMKPTKNGIGQYLQLEYTVLDGPSKGRKVWSRHNLVHPNAQTVQIARGELSAICRAVGVLTPNDSSEMHTLPMTITVKLKKRADNDELSNEISGWARKDAAAGVPQQASGAAPAWFRK
jgi:hypothetical protein